MEVEDAGQEYDNQSDDVANKEKTYEEATKRKAELLAELKAIETSLENKAKDATENEDEADNEEDADNNEEVADNNEEDADNEEDAENEKDADNEEDAENEENADNEEDADNEDQADNEENVDQVFRNIKTLPFLNAAKRSKKKEDGKDITKTVEEKQHKKKRKMERSESEEPEKKKSNRKKEGKKIKKAKEETQVESEEDVLYEGSNSDNERLPVGKAKKKQKRTKKAESSTSRSYLIKQSKNDIKEGENNELEEEEEVRKLTKDKMDKGLESELEGVQIGYSLEPSFLRVSLLLLRYLLVFLLNLIRGLWVESMVNDGLNEVKAALDNEAANESRVGDFASKIKNPGKK
ncbi:hypothetical protein Tco_1367137, partial [Tanacetum coccineum]